MIRFNEAAVAEEEEEIKRKKLSTVDVPKIQINSKDNQEIVGLERKHSRRRKSASGVVQQQVLWAQRRLSLKNSNDFNDIVDLKFQTSANKSSIPIEVKREVMMDRQRSESEEKEEEEFKKVRSRMALQGQSSFEKRSIDVVDEEKWLEDYEESVSEEETESSEDDRIFSDELLPRIYSDDEVEDTYHPRDMSQPIKSITDEPFQILTERKKLPDPNFVPKPILKKTDDKTDEKATELNKVILQESFPSKVRSRSPMPQFRKATKVVTRNRSQSLAYPDDLLPDIKSHSLPNSSPTRQRSQSLASPSNVLSDQELSQLLTSLPVAPGHNISAVAQISGITAASIVIPQRLISQKTADEEAKVVADHYADIVRSYSQKRRGDSNLTALEKWKQQAEAEEEQQKINLAAAAAAHNEDIVDIKPTIKTDPFSTPHNSYKEPIKIEESKIGLSKEEFQPYEQRFSSTNDGQVASTSKEFPERKRRKSSATIIYEPNIVEHHESSDAPNVTKERSSRQERQMSPHTKRSPTPQRGRILNRTSRKASKRSKTPAKSPSRLENWSDRSRRKSSPSPIKVSPSRNSLAPIPFSKTKPMLKEIMTQTSIGLELNYCSDSGTSSPGWPSRRQEELMAKAEVKVRSAVEYITDLAMFIVACWLYIFSNELFAIPVLLIMVYRQLKDGIRSMIPKWIVRRFNKTRTKKR